MRAGSIVSALFVGLLSIPAASAAPVTYGFTRIASISNDVISVTPYGINNSGQVLYLATLTDGSAIKIGDGSQTTEIARTGAGSPYLSFSPIPTFNDLGQVAFAAHDAATASLFIGDGLTTNAVIDTTGPFLGFTGNRPVDINNLGDLAFRATLDPIPGVPSSRSINLLRDGVLTEVVNSSTSSFLAFSGPSLNNNGDLAFLGTSDAGDRIVSVYSDNVLRTIADSAGALDLFSTVISINDSADIAFTASFDTGENAIFATSGGELAEIINSANSSFTSFSRPVINAAGDIAFGAESDQGETSINILRAGMISTIISSGDLLDGLVVASVFFDASLLNDHGDVAFLALFQDGTRAIYSATLSEIGEIPAPAALPLFVAGLAFFRIRRSANRARVSRV